MEYDPSRVSYEKLLDVFWKNHNPIYPKGRNVDPTGQYRSVIFYSTPEQEAIARESKEKQQKNAGLNRTVATLIEPATRFYRAEEYHQQYYEKLGLRSQRWSAYA